jgi:hypothetical protein
MPRERRRIGVLDCDVAKNFPPHVGFQFYGDRVQQWLSEDDNSHGANDTTTWVWTQFRVNSNDAWHLPTLAQVENDFDGFVIPGARTI